MTIVLVTKGKHECVDYAKVMLFDDETFAESFCESVRTGKVKYWTDAQIVNAGEEVELIRPE